MRLAWLAACFGVAAWRAAVVFVVHIEPAAWIVERGRAGVNAVPQGCQEQSFAVSNSGESRTKLSVGQTSRDVRPAAPTIAIGRTRDQTLPLRPLGPIRPKPEEESAGWGDGAFCSSTSDTSRRRRIEICRHRKCSPKAGWPRPKPPPVC